MPLLAQSVMKKLEAEVSVADGWMVETTLSVQGHKS